MMKILIFTLSLAILYCLNVSGQSFAPIGAKWTYGTSYGLSPKQDYIEVISEKDTIVNGQSCIKITGIMPLYGYNLDFMLVYEDDNTVYWYIPELDEFTVLYDFNKVAGESWTINLNDSCHIEVFVDSTVMDTINNIPLKVLFTSNEDEHYPPFDGKMIQSIGRTGFGASPIPNAFTYCTGFIADGGIEYSGLRCYQDQNIGFVDFEIRPSCDYVVSNISEINEDQDRIVAYPNPTIQTLHIESQSAQHIVREVNIIDISGRTLITKEYPDTSSIDVSALPQGLYFWQVVMKNGELVRGKFVKR